MGNPHRGEVEIEAAGKVWTLRFTVNSIAGIEKAFGDMPWAKVLGRFFDAENVLRADVIRIWRGGLYHYHRDLTEEAAGDLLEEFGEAAGVRAIVEALGLALPAPKEGAAENPPQARD